MPYEHRRGPGSHVNASLSHRQRSRRRIAAVSFLSNISLDGSHRDTNLRQFTSLGAHDRSEKESCHRNLRTLVGKGMVEFQQIPMETVADAGIPGVKEVHVKSMTSSEKFLASDAGQNVTITVNKSYNPNINWNIGPLDMNSSIVHSTAGKRSHVVTTLERCASASLHVVTRVKSLTVRSSPQNSVGNSINSIANSVPLIGEDVLDRKPAKRRGVDKENNAPGPRGKVDSSAGDWDNAHKDKQATRRRKHSSHGVSGSTAATHQATHSSCESLGPALVLPGSEKVPRKPSGSVSESSSSNAAATFSKDVKFVRVCRSSASHRTSSGSSSIGPSMFCSRSTLAACIAKQAYEGRVLLTTGRGAPLHVFSLVHDRGLGFGGGRQSEGAGRKRNVSGTRHLATITDASDAPPEVGGPALPAPAVGVGGKAQEMSYSHLLVSSPHYVSGRRHLSDLIPEECQQQPQSAPALPVHAVSSSLCQAANIARCFSHDPAMSASHVAVAATSHSQAAISNLAYDMSSCQPLHRYDYSPDMLDDPELRAGRHRKLLRFPSYLTSLLDYAKPDELKRELNEKFRAKFPHVRVTLSKLRSLKREMVHICQHSYSSSSSCGGDQAPEGVALLTVALAHSYFDSLCLSGAVHKTSRKPLAGACLLISAKLNDVKGGALVGLIEKIENQLRLERNELLSAEFTALLSLQFSIHAPTVHVNTRYQRLLFEH